MVELAAPNLDPAVQEVHFLVGAGKSGRDTLVLPVRLDRTRSCESLNIFPTHSRCPPRNTVFDIPSLCFILALATYKQHDIQYHLSCRLNGSPLPNQVRVPLKAA